MELLDRSDMITALNEHLRIEPARTAIITIDMKRVHLDHEVGTMLVSRDAARSVLERTSKLLGFARSSGMPVIHVILEDRGIPSSKQPFRDAVFATGFAWAPGGDPRVREHSLEGAPTAELMPMLGPARGDLVVRSKRRFSAFHGTDLETLLRDLHVDTVVLAGINTNTCVLSTAFDAANRDITTIVLSDCVASAYGEDLHVLGLEAVRRCFGWVLDVDEFVAKVRRGAS